MDLEQKAIERIRLASDLSLKHYGKPLVCTYSGGKDSDVMLELFRRAGIPFEVHNSHTTADAPQTVRHIRKVFKSLEEKGIKCEIEMPKYKGEHITMWKLIPLKLMPPTRQVRYCCQGNCGARWLFKCDCGKEVVTNAYPVKHGKTKSCGCWNEENKHNRYRIHGLTGTRIHVTWSHMKQRCYNSNCREYEHYGGRGISVCEEWKNSVAEFAKWAYANGYKENLTLDRIDNDGNYEPNNCRWVSMEAQENNKRNNHYYDIDAGCFTLSQISRMYNISRNSLYYWINKKSMTPQGAVDMLVAKKTG